MNKHLVDFNAGINNTDVVSVAMLNRKQDAAVAVQQNVMIKLVQHLSF